MPKYGEVYKYVISREEINEYPILLSEKIAIMQNGYKTSNLEYNNPFIQFQNLGRKRMFYHL